jgi:uncharacterized protein
VAIVRGVRIYPIKGLPPVDVNAATVLPSGALERDRRWALVDGRGRFVNGKNFANIHRIEARYDAGGQHVVIDGHGFELAGQGDAIATACAEILGAPLTWAENGVVGFPDDLVSPGPTLVSSASLAAVAGWFGLETEATRLRFRANIEVDDAEPFWEDALYGGAIRVGDVEVQAINPCQRCVVPSRDAVTGEATAGFQKRFAELRRAHLPAHASTALFNHYYRFTVNTRIPASEAGKTMHVGDAVVRTVLT